MRKYDFDPAASNSFKLERRVLGANMTNTSEFFWLPDGPPTQVWTVADFFVRTEADVDTDGLFTQSQRATSTARHFSQEGRERYLHFSKVDGHIYATNSGENTVYELVGDGWAPRFAFGGTSTVLKEGGDGDAETVARAAGLLAKPGEPPTDLDKAIAAAGDPDWKTRPWAWSDLNGDGKMEYTANNPEFKIDFNAKFSLDGKFHSTCFRASDGAYVCPCDDRKNGESSLLIVPPQTVNGKASYDWKDAKILPCAPGMIISDVLAQDGRFYVMRSNRALGNTCSIECYDESGKLLWTREHNGQDLVVLQSLGDSMFSVMDRGFSALSPVEIRTRDGDLVNEVTCRDAADCWSNGALRADPDTAYIGLVQAYKVTGLSTVKSAAATVNLPKAGS